MMKGQARRSGLVMGFDTHMIAGRRACSRPARPTQPNITNRSNPHYDETLTAGAASRAVRSHPPQQTADLRRQRAICGVLVWTVAAA
jgi:hypothetical protein